MKPLRLPEKFQFLLPGNYIKGIYHSTISQRHRDYEYYIAIALGNKPSQFLSDTIFINQNPSYNWFFT